MIILKNPFGYKVIFDFSEEDRNFYSFEYFHKNTRIRMHSNDIFGAQLSKLLRRVAAVECSMCVSSINFVLSKQFSSSNIHFINLAPLNERGIKKTKICQHCSSRLEQYSSQLNDCNVIAQHLIYWISSHSFVLALSHTHILLNRNTRT